MITIKELKKRNPVYNKIPDKTLAEKMHSQQYPMLPKEAFMKAVMPELGDGIRRGFLKDTGVAAIGSAVDAIELWFRAVRTLDQPGGADVIREAATSAIEWTKEIQAAHPNIFSPSEEVKEGRVRRAIYGGVRSFLPSVSAGLPGVLAGALLGSLPGAIIGYGASGGTIFGLAEYDEFIEEAKEHGLEITSEVQNAAMKSAFVEFGLEGVSNVIEAYMLKLGKPITGPLKQTLKNMMKTPARGFLKKLTSVAITETATEMLQESHAAYGRRKVGIPALPPLKAAREAIGPALVMSFLFAAGGSSIQAVDRSRLQKNIENNTVSKEKRLKAVERIKTNLNAINPEIATAWETMAKGRVEVGQNISLNKDLSAVATVLETNIRKNFLSEFEGIPEEVRTKLLGMEAKAPSDIITGTLGKINESQKIANALDDPKWTDELKEAEVTDPSEQVEFMIRHSITVRLETAINLEKRGETEAAEKIRAEAKEDAYKIAEVGSEDTRSRVREAFHILSDIGISLDLRTESAGAIYKLHVENEGSTYNLREGDLSGRPFYSVSPYKAREKKYKGKVISGNRIADYIETNKDLLGKSDHSVGTWYNPDDGYTYLDVVITVMDREEALRIARENDQEAIFDLKTFETVSTITGEGQAEGVTVEKLGDNFYRLTKEGRVVLVDKQTEGWVAEAEWTHLLKETSKTKEEAFEAADTFFEIGLEELPLVEQAGRGLLPDAPAITLRSMADQAASPEAISRVKTEKARGIKLFKIDTRSKKEIPLIGVDAVDIQPGPYDVIVRREPGKPDIVLSQGQKARAYEAPTREEILVEAEAAIPKGVEGALKKGLIEKKFAAKFLKALKSERGSLWLSDPDLKFTDPDAAEVDLWYDKTEKALTNTERLPSANKIKVGLRHNVLDVHGNISAWLDNQGVYGHEVTVLHDLISGAHPKASHIIESFKEVIYGGLDPEVRKYLDRYLFSIRVLAIDNFMGRKKKGQMALFDFLKTPQVKNAMTVEQHRTYVQNLPSKIKPELTNRARKYFAAMRWVLDDARKQGLITEASHESMSKVGPYMRRELIEYLDPVHNYNFKGNKISVNESGFDNLKDGSEEMYNTDSEMLLSEVIGRHVNRDFRNKASMAMYEFAKAEPKNGIVKVIPYKLKRVPRGWSRIYAIDGGKKIQMLMREDMASEWVMRDPVINESIGRFVRWGTGTPLLKAMATGLNPEFAITNFFRDVALVWASDYNKVYSSFLPKYLLQMGGDLTQVWSDAVHREGQFIDYLNEGGLMEFLTHQGRITKKQSGLLARIQKTMGWFGETSEILVRLALRNRGVKSGMPGYEATWNARNYLDFSKGGSWAKAADNGLPYLNASIQATRGMTRALWKSPAMFTVKMAQIMSLSMALFFMNRLRNKEPYDQVAPINKVNYWVIPIDMPFFDRNGNKKWPYIKIAKDQGQRIFATIGENVAKKLIGEEVDVDEIRTAIMEFFSITPAGIVPPPLKAMLGYMANYDFWRNEDIWKGSRYGEIEHWAESTRYTPPALKDLGEATGLSPERMRYALSQYFTSGNIWTSLSGHAYNRITSQVPENERDLMTEEILARRPGLRRVFSITDPSYEFRKEIKQVRKELNTSRFLLNKEFDTIVQDVLRDDKPQADIREFVYAQKSRKIRKRLLARYKWSKKLFRIPDHRWWLDLAETPYEARAQLYYNRWVQADPEERERLRKFLRKVPGVYSVDFRRSLRKIKRDLQSK